MNNLNITNIHDNSRSQVWIGLDSKKFQIRNSGNMIAIEDKANAVTRLKIGGSSGFTINYSGGKISFTANGGGLLAVSEPGRGGIEGCPYYYSHRDKYSGAAAYTMDIRSTNESDEENESISESDLPDATNLEDGTIMMVVNGHWVEYSFDDLYNMIIDKMNTEFTLHKI